MFELYERPQFLIKRTLKSFANNQQLHIQIRTPWTILLVEVSANIRIIEENFLVSMITNQTKDDY